MYKQNLKFTFVNLKDSKWKVTKNFETKTEFDLFVKSWSDSGYILSSEELIIQQALRIYPVVLKLDLKGSLGGYYTVIERFTSQEDYNKYEQEKLWNGYKIIGEKPYLNFN
jgi:hypothetical protein